MNKWAVLVAFAIGISISGNGHAGPADGLTENPPPVAPLNGFSKYELHDLTMGPPYAGQAANEKAVAKIREHLRNQVGPVISAWNSAGAHSASTNTLLIEPQVVEIKFIGGSARFWVGAMAGSSYVVLRVKMTEQPSGRVIGEPECFQRAAAMAGAWTMGGQDNDMLQRVVTLISGFLANNYDAAVGGPTGRVVKADKGGKKN